MELIPKQNMINLNWRTFERYPEQGSDIVLHTKGYRIRENKYCHGFIRIGNFDSITFDARSFVQQNKNIMWTYSWLPTSQLIISND